MLPTYLLIMISVYSIVFVVGFIGNAYVMVSLLMIIYDTGFSVRSKFRRISIYVLSLSIVDLLVLFMLPMLVAYFLKGAWQFGYLSCKIFWTIENVNKLLSVAILTVMSFERYIGVCKPFAHDFFKHYNAAIVIAFLLFFVIALCAPIIYYSGTIEHVILTSNHSIAARKMSCSADLPDAILPYFILYMFVFAFVFPVIFITLCYVMIIRKINKKSQRCSRTSSKVCESSNKVIRSIMWVVIFHFVCWTPFWAAVLLTLNTTSNYSSIFVVSPRTLAMIRLVTSFLPYINSAGNWIFYAAFNRQIQDTSRELRQRHARKFQNSLVMNAILQKPFALAARLSRGSDQRQDSLASFSTILETIKMGSLWASKIEQEVSERTEEKSLVATRTTDTEVEENTDDEVDNVIFC